LEGGRAIVRLSDGKLFTLNVVPHIDASGNMWLNVPSGHRPGYRVEMGGGGRTVAAMQLTQPYTTWIRRDLGELRAPVAITLGAMFLWQRPEPPDDR
jgi:hypothetical protein